MREMYLTHKTKLDQDYVMIVIKENTWYLVNVTLKYTIDLLTGNAFVYPVGLT
jgi:hypothetical protein